jgi:hypothetical protein
MENILITNTIIKDKVIIGFDLQDGSLALTTVEIPTTGDIELNPLVIKLTELLELNREVEIDYIDSLSILETDSKIELVKETLDEIYDSFNSNIDGIVVEDNDVDLL